MHINLTPPSVLLLSIVKVTNHLHDANHRAISGIKCFDLSATLDTVDPFLLFETRLENSVLITFDTTLSWFIF